METRASRPHPARIRPKRPPKPESITLSVSTWRAMRPRPAPSALRTAISRSRPADRASMRPATFAQPTNNTKPTAASRTSKPYRTCETIASFKKTNRMDSPTLCSMSTRAEITAQSLWARSSVTPELSLATT